MTTTSTTLVPRLDDAIVLDRARACLLGGALGDALGADIEFKQAREITSRDLNAPERLCPTDDTQMTLFTLEALLRHVRHENLSFSDAVEAAYLRWLITQQRRHPAPAVRGLLTEPELYVRRAPGATCLTALQDLSGRAPVSNDSKGCGAVMRAAPIGVLPMVSDPQGDKWVFQLGAATGRVTHHHPSGYLPAGCLAVMVRALLDGDDLLDAVGRALKALRSTPADRRRETAMALRKALDLFAAPRRLTPSEIELHLGGGWTGEECLAIAVYAALQGNDARDGLQIAVNHSGDSDSTGAVAGNLLGALHGTAGLPQEWLARLEWQHIIDAMADQVPDLAR